METEKEFPKKEEKEKLNRQMKRPLVLDKIAYVAVAVTALFFGASAYFMNKAVNKYEKAKKIEQLVTDSTGKPLTEVEQICENFEEKNNNLRNKKEQLETMLAETKQEYENELEDRKNKEKELKDLLKKQATQIKDEISTAAANEKTAKELAKYKTIVDNLTASKEEISALLSKSEKNRESESKKYTKETENLKNQIKELHQGNLIEGISFKDGDIQGKIKGGLPVVIFPEIGDKIDASENKKYNLGFDKYNFVEAQIKYVPTNTNDISKIQGYYIIEYKWKKQDTENVIGTFSKEKILEIYKKIKQK